MKLNYGYLFKDMLKVRWGIFFYYIIFELNVLPQLQSLYSSKVRHSFGLFTDFMISKIDQILFEFYMLKSSLINIVHIFVHGHSRAYILSNNFIQEQFAFERH